MRKIVSLCAVLLLFSALAFAQPRTVSGVITDGAGRPVPFASVTVKGTNNGTSADANGKFTLQNVATGAVLSVSSTGFTEKEITVTSSGNVDIQMDQKSQLQEVVVTALGIQRQRKELGYATAKVNNEELTKAAPINIATGLQGKVSGLNVTSINNGVFAEVKINLRGIRSLTGNNNPMLVLDGVPTPLRYLSSLNPNDVSDVTVLKGSSGAGVYGPDARNGVIIITTKAGVRSDVPVVTVSQTVQAERISFFPEFQYQFGSGGYGDYIPYENWSWGPAFDGSMVELGHELPDGTVQMVPYTGLKDEKKKFWNTGMTYQTDVSFGAKDFYLSVQDARITGVTPDDRNRRTGIRLNTARTYGKFRAGFNVNYIQQNYDIFDQNQMNDYHVNQNVGLNGGLLNLIFNTPGHIPITSYKDFVNNPYAQYNTYFNDYGLNPYFAIDNWRQKGKNDDLLANIDLGFKATDWLSFTYRAAVAVNSLTSEGTSKGEIPTQYGLDRGFASVPGAAFERSNRSSRLTSEVFGNFKKELGDFRLNVIAGQYFRQTDARDNRVSASNLVVPELFNVGNRTGELGGSNSVSRSRLVSVYGNVGLSYKGWANIEFSGRNEWTSVLAVDKNSFFYPGVNASVVLTDAINVLKSSNLISYLKLRASWNKTGNADIDPYLLAATYAQASGFPYGSLPGFTAENTAYDPSLKPEFIESKEVGLEVSFLRNRINVELAYFHQDNTDQIIPIRVSDATGFTNSFVNAASFVNKGFEIDLRLTPLVRVGDARIDFKANATYNDSKVNSIYQDLDRIFAGGYDNFAANYAIVGNPAFVFSATDYMRDDQGRVIVNAATGYPDVDPNTKTFGRTMPLWIVGLNPTVSWKGLNLSILGEYKGGHYAYHNIGPDMAWTGISKATGANSRERFVFPNSSYWDGSKYVANTDIAVSNVNDFYTGVYRDVASNFITSAASWRIREVSLGYDIPVRVFGNQKVIKGITVTLNARNLFLWLPKTNDYTDPDFNFSSGNSSGVNTSQIYPPTRIFGGNITLRF